MKKYISIIVSIVCLLSIAACGKNDTYEVEIIIPAGSTEAFVYSDEEIRPTGNKITISSGAGLGDTEVILKPVNENVETGYVATYLTRGMPVEFDTLNVNDGWFKIGVSVQNDSDEGPIAVSVEVKGVEVRISQNNVTSTEAETITYNGKEYKKSELCDATLHWLELSEQERIASSYMPPEFMELTENWGITLTAENITPTSSTIKCTQNGGEPTGELQTGTWYILETWTQKDGWKETEYLKSDVAVGWEDVGYTIPMDSTSEFEVNWEWLYGELSPGKYRIGKEIMDFRRTGDYDTAIYYAEFEITE